MHCMYFQYNTCMYLHVRNVTVNVVKLLFTLPSDGTATVDLPLSFPVQSSLLLKKGAFWEGSL